MIYDSIWREKFYSRCKCVGVLLLCVFLPSKIFNTFLDRRTQFIGKKLKYANNDDVKNE